MISKNPRDKGLGVRSGREQSLRFSPRSPANGLVRIQSSEKEFSGYLVNISHEGLMTKARDLPDPKERITVSFRLLPTKHEYQMKGVVVWAAPFSELDRFKRMGVRFIDPGEKERKRIRKYVSKFTSTV